LNFVNNFSELSVDLAKELKEEVEKLEIPEKDKEYVTEIIGDLSQNQEKINHHGKRASDIVKGMLEHSRKSDRRKELTDINATYAMNISGWHIMALKAKDNETLMLRWKPILILICPR
jgi:two-component system NtrC family sensor kinase